VAAIKKKKSVGKKVEKLVQTPVPPKNEKERT
jgi:hypothetical protein